MDEKRIERQTRSAFDDGGGARLLSVGHSNCEWPAFVTLLHGAGVTALADVRSQPYSGRYPYFNKAPLQNGLREEEIAYVFLGDLLGGRPVGLRCTTTRGASITSACGEPRRSNGVWIG